jgi:hypothetical protein
VATLVGQWFGKLTGGSEGTAVLNIERDGQGLQGRILIEEGEPRFGYVLRVRASHDHAHTRATATLESLMNYQTHSLEPLDNAATRARAREFHLPDRVDTEFSIDAQNKSVESKWRTNWDNEGSATLRSMLAPQWSERPTQPTTWNEFKQAVAAFDRGEWVFRGQAAPWPLRTYFHRRGRYDLIRYAAEDAAAIHHTFVASTNQWMHVTDPVQHASLLAVAQHHGYPTPLLDWTRSPFTAAYFAVREVGPDDAPGGPRIYAFHAQRWRQSQFQAFNLHELVPTVTVLESVPFLNPRAVQQQSITTMTNIDHVERYIDSLNSKALQPFDFDPSERELILDELQWMGVTESLLFPGLEGSFRTLARERFPE